MTFEPSRTDERRFSVPYRDLIRRIATLETYGTSIPRRAIQAEDGRWLVMAGSLDGGPLVTKMLYVRDRRRAGQPSISGRIVAMSHDGDVLVNLDAEPVTVARTAAIAAYATERLARPDASVLALFGTGALAMPHVEAIDLVRPLDEIRVVGRSQAAAEALAGRLRARGWSARSAMVKEALAGADIITTVTTSSVPLFEDIDVPEAAHINAMGSFLPTTREIPGATVGRARVVLDAPETEEVGELAIARREGFVCNDVALANLLDHDRLGAVRRTPEDITLLKSAGHIVFDVAAISLWGGERHRRADQRHG